MGEANPHLSPLPLYRRGNRGCGFAKHTFPTPLWEHLLTPCLASASPCWGWRASLYLPGSEKHKAGVAFRLWGGGRLGFPSRHHLPSCCHLPSSITQSWRKPTPSSCPQTQRRPWLGRPPSQPLGPMFPWRRARKPGPIERRRWRLPWKAAARGKEKREEKKLLMHIMSVELSMTN